MNLSPFDFINSISQNKTNLIVDSQTEKEYNPFIVNRGLSYFQDTIMYANEMNRLNHLDKKPQYDFLINIIRPKKRFSKWAKRNKNNDIDAIMEYYGYSYSKAKDALLILSATDVKTIKRTLEKGG